MKAYKGFDKGFVYRSLKLKVGRTYTVEKEPKFSDVEHFHACTSPGDLFRQYPPLPGTVYAEVEMSGEIKHGSADSDSSIFASKMKIVRVLTVEKIVSLAARLNGKYTRGVGSIAASKSPRSTVEARWPLSAAAACGNCSTAATRAPFSTAATSGDWSTAYSLSSSSLAAARGYRSVAVTSMWLSLSAARGDMSMAIAHDSESVAVAWGGNAYASAGLGSAIVLPHFVDGKLAKVVTAIAGRDCKPDTLYTVDKDGNLVEVEQ